jgi:hypothetical protein
MFPYLLFLLSSAAAPPPSPTPLVHAHAHNDYEHPRPLFDALDRGFCSVEADIFLVKGELLVGHTMFDLRSQRTLEKLYLEPLRQRIRARGGQVHAGNPPFYLLIDVKTEARATYEALDRVLARYADILSVTREGRFERKAVTVVISGNCDRDAIGAQKVRYAGIDGRPGDLKSDAPAHLIPWISASWSSQFRWRGEGDMPTEERARLQAFVKQAHEHGRLVRFWGTPEREGLWRELRSAGVDLVNTDRLDALREFLLRERAGSVPQRR